MTVLIVMHTQFVVLKKFCSDSFDAVCVIIVTILCAGIEMDLSTLQN